MNVETIENGRMRVEADGRRQPQNDPRLPGTNRHEGRA